jgi:chaperone required for assembly of F1-ATPase
MIRSTPSFFNKAQVKRFYDKVSTEFSPSEKQWKILLDGKTLRTPARAPLLLPTKSLAEGVAFEFEDQTDLIRPALMPLMTIASTAIDVTRHNMATSIDRISAFLETDTVSFLHESDDELREKQISHWNPLREAVQIDHGIETNQAVGLTLPQGQSEPGKKKLLEILENLDFWKLTTFEIGASYSKSAVIALALLNNRIDVEKAIEAALVEELHQREIWGTVEGDHDIAESETAMWLASCKLFVDLLDSNNSA